MTGLVDDGAQGLVNPSLTGAVKRSAGEPAGLLV